MSPKKAIAIIPARYASTRFPGKPLAKDTGRYLIQHVYERASLAKQVSQVIVATDDQRIYDAVNSFGGQVIMTRADHPNGTSRLAEVVGGIQHADTDIIVNVQGDEPELAPESIDQAIQALTTNPQADVATLAIPINPNSDDAQNPNVVKVVCDNSGQALYFSRATIPFKRAGQCAEPLLKHVGLYVYRRAFLLEYVNWPITPLEKAESLEQLRILENNRQIAVAILEESNEVVGIDTPEQYAAFVQRYRGSADA